MSDRCANCGDADSASHRLPLTHGYYCQKSDVYVGTSTNDLLTLSSELDAKLRENTVVDPVTGGRKGQKLAQPSQIPPDVLWELAEHYGKGNAKYPDVDGKPNWQRGYSWRLSVDALTRHLLAFLMGEDMDPETGSSHLIAVIWHCMTLRYFQLHDKGTDYR
jgi:hypothetical protein